MTPPSNPADPMNAKQAVAWVKECGIAMESARASVPSLAQVVAGEPLRGSWWAHPKGKEIFRAAEAICESPNVLVCKLVEGKITYVHRRLWPALVKLGSRFREEQLAKVRDEHTPSGAHQSRRERFPIWVPSEVMKEAKALSVAEAESILSPWSCLRPKCSDKRRGPRSKKDGPAQAKTVGRKWVENSNHLQLKHAIKGRLQRTKSRGLPGE